MPIARTLIALTLLSSLSLTGCQKQTPPQEAIDQTQVETLVRDFLTELASGKQERPMGVYSVPFWADGHWILTEEQLHKEIPTTGPEDAIVVQQVGVRLYPIAHLDVLNPSALKRLHEDQTSVTAMEDLYIAAVRAQYQERGQDRDETGWLLMRRTPTGWKVAGVIEK